LRRPSQETISVLAFIPTGSSTPRAVACQTLQELPPGISSCQPVRSHQHPPHLRSLARLGLSIKLTLLLLIPAIIPTANTSRLLIRLSLIFLARISRLRPG